MSFVSERERAILIEESMTRTLLPNERRRVRSFLEEGRSEFGWGPSDPGYALIGASRLSSLSLHTAFEAAKKTPPYVPSLPDLMERDGDATFEELLEIHQRYPFEGSAQGMSIPLDGLIIYGCALLCELGSNHFLNLRTVERLRKERPDEVSYHASTFVNSWPLVSLRSSARSSLW